MIGLDSYRAKTQSKTKAGEMPQWVKAPTVKPADGSLNPGSPGVGAEWEHLTSMCVQRPECATPQISKDLMKGEKR